MYYHVMRDVYEHGQLVNTLVYTHTENYMEARFLVDQFFFHELIDVWWVLELEERLDRRTNEVRN